MTAMRGLYGFIINNEHYLVDEREGMRPRDKVAHLIHEAASIAETTVNGPDEDCLPTWDDLRVRVQQETDYLDLLEDDRAESTEMLRDLVKRECGLEDVPRLLNPNQDLLYRMCPHERDPNTGVVFSSPSFLHFGPTPVTTISDPREMWWAKQCPCSVVADLDRNELVICSTEVYNKPIMGTGTYSRESRWKPIRSYPLDDPAALNDAFWEFSSQEPVIKTVGEVFPSMSPKFCGDTPRTLADPSLTAGGLNRRPPGFPRLRSPRKALVDPTIAAVQRGVDAGIGSAPAGNGDGFTDAQRRQRAIDLKKAGHSIADIMAAVGRKRTWVNNNTKGVRAKRQPHWR